LERFSDELKTNSSWLSSLSFTASAAKENANKVEPDICYSGKNRVEKKAAVVPLKSSIYDRAKLKTGPTEIIHQRPPIFDKTSFIISKSIILNVFRTEEFCI